MTECQKKQKLAWAWHWGVGQVSLVAGWGAWERGCPCGFGGEAVVFSSSGRLLPAALLHSPVLMQKCTTATLMLSMALCWLRLWGGDRILLSHFANLFVILKNQSQLLVLVAWRLAHSGRCCDKKELSNQIFKSQVAAATSPPSQEATVRPHKARNNGGHLCN